MLLIRKRLELPHPNPPFLWDWSEWSLWGVGASLTWGWGANVPIGKIKCQELLDGAYCCSHYHLPRDTCHSSLPSSFSEFTLSDIPVPIFLFYPGFCHVPNSSAIYVTHQRESFPPTCSFASDSLSALSISLQKQSTRAMVYVRIAGHLLLCWC